MYATGNLQDYNPTLHYMLQNSYRKACDIVYYPVVALVKDTAISETWLEERGEISLPLLKCLYKIKQKFKCVLLNMAFILFVK